MPLPARKYTNGIQYRYGFNGKELDTEGLVQYDYGFRIYDPRLGRFKSVDPLTKEYPWNSTYAFAENDVIRSIDLDGLEKLIIHEIYDKYGRRNNTELSGIRGKDTKAAIKLDMASKMGIPLAKDDVYVLRHRNSRNGSIFFEGNAGTLSKAKIQAIKEARTVQGEETTDLPPGTMQQGETTSRGRFYFSPLVDNSNHEFFESQTPQNNTPSIEGSNKLMADFVGGTLIDGNMGSSTGLKVDGTTSIISEDINHYVSGFKANNNLNVAFVEQITITIPNNDNRQAWNSIKSKLTQKYQTSVTIKVDDTIQRTDMGAKIMDKAAGTYGSIKYKVSGVGDGNKTRAAPGAQ